MYGIGQGVLLAAFEVYVPFPGRYDGACRVGRGQAYQKSPQKHKKYKLKIHGFDYSNSEELKKWEKSGVARLLSDWCGGDSRATLARAAAAHWLETNRASPYLAFLGKRSFSRCDCFSVGSKFPLAHRGDSRLSIFQTDNF